MTLQTSTNFASTYAYQYPDDDNDAFDTLHWGIGGKALNDHTHRVGLGTGVGRVGSVAPAATGDVQITGDTFRFWAGSAAAIYTAVTLEGTQTITGAKTWSAAANFTGTLAVAGLTTLTGDGERLKLTHTTATSQVWQRIANGTVTSLIGVESSAGGQIMAGSSAYAAVWGTSTAHPVHIGTNNTVRVTFAASSGDVTFTGALGGITTLTTSGAINSQTISAAASFTGSLAVATTLTAATVAATSAVNLSSGVALNWNSGDVTVTHSANALAFAGASSGYTFDAQIISTGGASITGTGSGGVLLDGAGATNVRILQGATQVLSANIANNLIAGSGSAIATNATGGFLCIPTCAGAPTGTVGAAGQAAFIYDSTNLKLYVSVGGGTWKSVTLS